MKKQTIFDEVIRHCQIQKQRSTHMVDGKIQCAYRGDNGKRCVVGIFIPNEKYSEELEGLTIDAEQVLRAIPFTVTKQIKELLSTLQSIHDNSVDYPLTSIEVYNRLSYIADELNLSKKVLNFYKWDKCNIVESQFL